MKATLSGCLACASPEQPPPLTWVTRGWASASGLFTEGRAEEWVNAHNVSEGCHLLVGAQ